MGLWILVALIAVGVALVRIRRLTRAIEPLQQQVSVLTAQVALLQSQQPAEPVAPAELALPAHNPTYAPPRRSQAMGETTPAPLPQPAPVPPWQMQPPTDPAPTEPSPPSLVDKLLGRIVSYFTEGNLVVRVGIIVLFFGVAFLLQYANAQGAFDAPIEVRLVAVALLGVALLVVGWLLRHKRRVYGLILQGGGLGITYITVFAALQLYDVLPAGVSLALLVVMVGVGAALALVQNSSTLAVVAVIGGFLAPLLTSTGQGSHVGLFSYYLVLNVGILAIAWFRSWRALNLVGFVFTFIIATLWGVLEYTPANRGSIQIFLILFFLFYVAIAVLYARRQPPQLRGLIDPTLIFGVPVVAFGLQASLVADTEYGVAISSLVLGVLYAALRQLCRVLGGPAYLLLSRTFLALALVFGSLSVPFAFDGEWVATAWALEGAAVLWIALIQRSRLGVGFALGLQLLAGLLYVPSAAFDRDASLAVANAVFLGGLLLAVASVISSWLLTSAAARRSDTNVLPRIAALMQAWAVMWWLINGVLEIITYVQTGTTVALLIMVYVAATAALLGILEVVKDWAQWRYAVFGLFVFSLVIVLPASTHGAHPFAGGLGWGWLAIFASVYALLYIRDARGGVSPRALVVVHTGTWWLLSALASSEVVWLIDQSGVSPQWVVLGIPLTLVVAVFAATRARGWPLERHRRTYLRWGSLAPVLALLTWSVPVNPALSGDFSGLPHVPLVNPLDLTQLLVLVVLIAWWKALHAAGLAPVPRRYGWVVACDIAFVWLTAIVLRALNHWTEIPYTPQGLWASDVAQAAVSIMWTLVALTAMVVAARRGWRRLWVAAVSVLGVVVVKLFVVDMRDSDTLGSIIAFIAVGLLLLLAGYLSPLPPKRGVDEDTPAATSST